jgi:hypothetical protein
MAIGITIVSLGFCNLFLIKLLLDLFNVSPQKANQTFQSLLDFISPFSAAN